MINRLNSSNPTQLLLGAIRLAGIDMLSPTGSFRNSEEFFLGLVSPTGEVHIVFISWERKPTYFVPP
jgi:phosphatidylserine synthase